MLNDDKKQERRSESMHRSIAPQLESTEDNSGPKKPTSILGFKLGLLRENAVALPLAPPQLPDRA